MSFLFPYLLAKWRRHSADRLEKGATTRRKDAGSLPDHMEYLSLTADVSRELCVSVNVLFVKLPARQSISTDCFIYPNQSMCL